MAQLREMAWRNGSKPKRAIIITSECKHREIASDRQFSLTRYATGNKYFQYNTTEYIRFGESIKLMISPKQRGGDFCLDISRFGGNEHLIFTCHTKTCMQWWQPTKKLFMVVSVDLRSTDRERERECNFAERLWHNAPWSRASEDEMCYLLPSPCRPLSLSVCAGWKENTNSSSSISVHF